VTRLAEPQISLADLVFAQQGMAMHRVLESISDLLHEQRELIEQVRVDLQRGVKNPATGRNGMTPEEVLRSLVLKQVKNWDYRQLRERIADGYTLRSFTDFGTQPVPKHDAFNRAFNRLTDCKRHTPVWFFLPLLTIMLSFLTFV
jgi:transposase, IS5 family